MLKQLMAEIKKTADERGYSNTVLAAKLDISTVQIHRLKTGKARPNIDLLTKIKAEFPELRDLVLEYEESLVKEVTTW